MDTRKKLWIVDGVLAVILVIICVGGYFVLHPMPSEIPLLLFKKNEKSFQKE